MLTTIRDRVYRLLRWSEKYTKTDMVYIAQGGFWLTWGTVITSFLSLAIMYLFANFLPKEAYGTYQYFLSALSIAAIATLAGMGVSATRSIARGFDGTLIDTLKTKFKWGLFGTLGAALVSIYYFIQDNSILGYGFLIVAITTPLWGTVGIYTSYLQGKSQFRLMSIYDVFIKSFELIILGATLLITNNPVWALLAYLASSLLTRGYYLFKTVRAIPPSAPKDSGALRYGWHITGMSAFETVVANADKLLLWHILGPVSVASYIFSTAIPIKLADTLRIINRLAFPKFAQATLEDSKLTLLPKIIKLSVTSIILVGAYIISAPWIFQTFFSSYVDVVLFTQIAALIILFQPFNLIATYLSAKAHTKKLYVYRTISPLVRLVLMATLISLFHLMGAIAALIISRVFDVLLLLGLYIYKSQKH